MLHADTKEKFVKIPLNREPPQSIWDYDEEWAEHDRRGKHSPPIPLFEGYPVARNKSGRLLFSWDFDRIGPAYVILGPFGPRKAQAVAELFDGRVVGRSTALKAPGFYTDG